MLPARYPMLADQCLVGVVGMMPKVRDWDTDPHHARSVQSITHPLLDISSG